METIKAKAGWLTQVTTSENERLFFRSITTATPSGWHEVDESFKEQWESEHQNIEEE